jgi:hypothetical protein
MLLADMRSGFSCPCVADFKIGTRQHDITSTEEFRIILTEKAEISTSKTLGLRLVSMTLARGDRVFVDSTKSDNLELTEEELEQQIEMFIPNTQLQTVHRKLEGMRNAYLEMLGICPRMRWYSGSILITHDGDDCEKEPRVVLIDFAHFHWDIDLSGGDGSDPGFDDGNIIGFETFLRMVQNCISRTKEGEFR